MDELVSIMQSETYYSQKDIYYMIFLYDVPI